MAVQQDVFQRFRNTLNQQQQAGAAFAPQQPGTPPVPQRQIAPNVPLARTGTQAPLTWQGFFGGQQQQPAAPVDPQQAEADRLKQVSRDLGLAGSENILRASIMENIIGGGLTPAQRQALEGTVMEQTALGSQEAERQWREYMASRGLLESSETGAGMRDIFSRMAMARTMGLRDVELEAMNQRNIAIQQALGFQGTIRGQMAQQQQQDAGLLQSLFGIGAAAANIFLPGAGAAMGAIAPTVGSPGTSPSPVLFQGGSGALIG